MKCPNQFTWKLSKSDYGLRENAMDSKRIAKNKGSGRKTPTAVGTGLIALDVVIADSTHVDPRLCAGGTCGNVLTALAYLDWNAYPIARLRADAASKRVTEDLQSWGVRLDFVALSDQGSTPIVVQHIRRNKAGEPYHSFSRKCPQCGSWLPWYKPVKAADVSEIVTRLPAADVFYFDRTSRGAVEFARHAKENGSLVVFEPSCGSEPALLAEALKASHIVKIASDRLEGNEGVLDAREPILLIETQKASGLRYMHHGAAGSARWKKVAAFRNSSVIDTAGAGDWCTAGIISALGPLGVNGLANAPSNVVVAALRVGQAMAAWTCQFHGARGGMYESTKEDFTEAIKAILEGEDKMAPTCRSQRDAKLTSNEPLWCDCCLVEEGRSERAIGQVRQRRAREQPSKKR
jgi:sugar/nucleoside kinase (ribokinase family)